MNESQSTNWFSEDMIGGDPSLDLVNTGGGRGKARDIERLTNLTDVLSWAVIAGLVTEIEAGQLGDLRENPEPAIRDLQAFREDLHAVLLAVSAAASPPPKNRSRLESVLRLARSTATLVDRERQWFWSIPLDECGHDTVRLRAALAADRLLTGNELGLVRNCERCSWLYVDRSRGRRRRWCSMAACGNRAKAQRHYKRARQQQGDN